MRGLTTIAALPRQGGGAALALQPDAQHINEGDGPDAEVACPNR